MDDHDSADVTLPLLYHTKDTKKKETKKIVSFEPNDEAEEEESITSSSEEEQEQKWLKEAVKKKVEKQKEKEKEKENISMGPKQKRYWQLVALLKLVQFPFGVNKDVDASAFHFASVICGLSEEHDNLRCAQNASSIKHSCKELIHQSCLTLEHLQQASNISIYCFYHQYKTLQLIPKEDKKKIATLHLFLRLSILMMLAILKSMTGSIETLVQTMDPFIQQVHQSMLLFDIQLSDVLTLIIRQDKQQMFSNPSLLYLVK